MLGLTIVSLVSFYDDLRPLPNKIRLTSQLVAVSLMFIQTEFTNQPIWLIGFVGIAVIGTLNAYNFMDGINGITGSYSLITVLSLYFLNEKIQFVSADWLVVSVLALAVFIFFNFRTKAKCFAGDVGSVSIAFIIIFFLLQLIIKTSELKYVGLLLIYGLDSITTIIFRLVRKENIFEAHRSHFYQHLVNVKGWAHLWVSVLYMAAQLTVNILIIIGDLNWLMLFFSCFSSGLLFIGLRLWVEGRDYLVAKRK